MGAGEEQRESHLASSLLQNSFHELASLSRARVRAHTH